MDATFISGEDEPLLLDRLAAASVAATWELSLMPLGLIDDSRAVEMVGESRLVDEPGGELLGEVVLG